jgi:hypothetical protein
MPNAISFIKMGDEKSEYETEVDALALQIQDSIDILDNKNRLTKLLLPFISALVNDHMPSFYGESDANDAVQEFLVRHILDESSPRNMYLYLYNHESNKSFCKYLIIKFSTSYLNNWKRNYHAANHKGQSLDDENPKALRKDGTPVEYEVSLRRFEQKEELRDFRECIRLLVPNYMMFFNAVNSLDKDKTYGKPFSDGERVVNEQKLLAYYIRFINKEFRSFPDSKYANIEQMRLFTFIKVNQSNNDYLKKAIFSVTIEFMQLLDDRIISRNLTEAVFLPPEMTIRTTVDKWLRSPRMKDQIDKEREQLKASNIAIGKDFGYGIR